jgi:rubrerythrin
MFRTYDGGPTVEIKYHGFCIITSPATYGLEPLIGGTSVKKTIENLAKAFIGESQARNRYTMYASVARSEGYEQIGAIFLETADQEKEHAKQIFMMLQKIKSDEKLDLAEVKVDSGCPMSFGTTADNLKAAMEGEHYENSAMYPTMAKDAEVEGYSEVAGRLKRIIVAETHHEQRYAKLLKEIKGTSFFKKKTKVWWTCRECGYIHYGEEPPEECPLCSHARAFYQLLHEEY